jgi:outer membrane protein
VNASAARCVLRAACALSPDFLPLRAAHMRLSLAFFGIVVVAMPLRGQASARRLTLDEAVALAQSQGLAAQAARSARDAAQWRDRAFGARLRPYVSISGNAANLERGFNPQTLPSGERQFIRESYNQSSLGLTVAQPLPWTGTELTVSSLVTRIDQFGDEQTPQFWQTTPVLLGIRQGLFRPRTVLWEQRENDLEASVADRRYREAREEVAMSTASAFFDLHAADVALQNAVANAAVNDTLFILNKGRFEVGKIGENELLQSELALLRARASLDGAKLERDRAEASVRRLLALPGDVKLEAVPPTQVTSFAADPDAAVGHALRGASEIEASELEAVRAKRRVVEARYANAFGATIEAQVGFNGPTANAFGPAYQSLLDRQKLVVGVSMPVLQWGGGRAQVQAAKSDEVRVATVSKARRDQIAEEARFGALQLAQARRMLDLSAKADTVAAKRFEVSKNRYVIGKIGMSDLYIAQNEKDQALLAYVQALRGYWTAYYRLRRLTLYDFAAGKEIEN